MSIRNYNSTKPQRRFQRRNSRLIPNKQPIDYTELYKLQGVPIHNAEAVKQFDDKCREYQRLLDLKKCKMEREKINEKFGKKEIKKTNNQNRIN